MCYIRIMKYLFTHGHLIVDNNHEYLDGSLLVEDEYILDVYPQSNRLNDIEDCEVIDLKGSIVMPGFFDSHTHGIGGMCFDSINSKEDLDKVSLQFSQSGTTSFLASISYDVELKDFDDRIKVYDPYVSSTSRFVGLHLEGPFLSKHRVGIGNPDKFSNPNAEAIKELLNKTNCIKQMTIAYELDGAKEVGKLLHDHGVRVMVGHSEATLKDLDENVDGFTHLFNAMRGFHHRDKTLVNCAFMNKWYCEIIGDGHHVDPSVLKIVIDNIDQDKIVLVSDSSLARNLPDGEYEFMSNHCVKKGSEFINENGTYSGSVVSINDEIKVLYSIGAKYTDLLSYSSLNAFKLYGLDKRYGTLQKGKYADIVIMDDDLNIKNVYVQGKFIK